jgi:hypothetical protein
VEVHDGVFYVSRLPSGPIVVLRDIAALIWEESRADDDGTVAERVAARTAQPVSGIRGEVEQFIEGLIAEGLLVRAE